MLPTSTLRRVQPQHTLIAGFQGASRRNLYFLAFVMLIAFSTFVCINTKLLFTTESQATSNGASSSKDENGNMPSIHDRIKADLLPHDPERVAPVRQVIWDRDQPKQPAPTVPVVHGIPPQIPQHYHDQLKPRAKPVRVIDGFTINTELDMLELRLEELYDTVDYFIIVEATYTFQNTPKELYYENNKQRFSKFHDKIVHVIVDERPPEFKYWENEVFVRNAIGTMGLKKLARLLEQRGEAPLTDDDLLIISDLDEIPDHVVVRFFKEYEGFPPMTRISMRWTYYSFMWVNFKNWDMGAMTTLGELHKYTKNKDETNFVRYNNLELQQQNKMWTVGSMEHPAGWHCSWCLPIELIVNKIESFSHSEYNTPQNKDPKRLSKLKSEGRWIMDGNKHRTRAASIVRGETAPSFAVDNKDRFAYLFE